MEKHQFERLLLSDIQPEFLRDKVIFVRVDFNVILSRQSFPLHPQLIPNQFREFQQSTHVATGPRNYVINNDSKIKLAMPTLNYLINCGAKVVVGTHLGDPDLSMESLERHSSKYSTQNLVYKIAQYVEGDNVVIAHCPAVVGPVRQHAQSQMQSGSILLLENLRFHTGERLNDPSFCLLLGEGIDLFVNEAFSQSHRCLGSNAGIVSCTGYSIAVPGYALVTEVMMLSACVCAPLKPFSLILGGLKLASKLPLLTSEKSLLNHTSQLLIGGALSFPFLKAQGVDIGVVNEMAMENGDATAVGAKGGHLTHVDSYVHIAANILSHCATRGITVLLPRDFKCLKLPSSDDDKSPPPSFKIPYKDDDDQQSESLGDRADLVQKASMDIDSEAVEPSVAKKSFDRLKYEDTHLMRESKEMSAITGVRLPTSPDPCASSSPPPYARDTGGAYTHGSAFGGIVSIAPKYNQHPFHHAQVQAILNIPVSQLKVGCYLGLDIGEESVKMFTNALEKSKTVLWNGPLGKCDEDHVSTTSEFAAGTNKMIDFLKTMAIPPSDLPRFQDIQHSNVNDDETITHTAVDASSSGMREQEDTKDTQYTSNGSAIVVACGADTYAAIESHTKENILEGLTTSRGTVDSTSFKQRAYHDGATDDVLEGMESSKEGVTRMGGGGQEPISTTTTFTHSSTSSHPESSTKRSDLFSRTSAPPYQMQFVTGSFTLTDSAVHSHLRSTVKTKEGGGASSRGALTHVSLSGGAALVFLAGGAMPGLDSLSYHASTKARYNGVLKSIGEDSAMEV